jgi:hypothetical protein
MPLLRRLATQLDTDVEWEHIPPLFQVFKLADPVEEPYIHQPEVQPNDATNQLWLSKGVQRGTWLFRASDQIPGVYHDLVSLYIQAFLDKLENGFGSTNNNTNHWAAGGPTEGARGSGWVNANGIPGLAVKCLQFWGVASWHRGITGELRQGPHQRGRHQAVRHEAASVAATSVPMV